MEKDTQAHLPTREEHSTSPDSHSQNNLYARYFLQRAIDALTAKQKDYESVMLSEDIPSLRLLFADSVSVIQDCI